MTAQDVAGQGSSSPDGARRVLDYDEVKEPSFLERLLEQDRWTFLGPSLSSAQSSPSVWRSCICTSPPSEHRGPLAPIHTLTVMLVLAILIKPLFRRSHFQPILRAGDPKNALRAAGFAVDLALVFAVLAIQVWTLWDIVAFHNRLGDKNPIDQIAGFAMIALILEATRRAVGPAMVFVTGFFIVTHSTPTNSLVSSTVRQPGRPSTSIRCS